MPVDSFFLAKSFVTLLVIIDPVGVVPVFLAMTGPYDPGQRHRAAWQAVLVAALIIGVFALFGQQILLYLGIRLPSLEAAGGLLLLVVALDLLRGEVQELAGEGKVNVAFVPLGTPLLAGPGAIAAIMVFMREAGTAAERVGVALGLLGVLVVLWLALRFAGMVRRLLGQAGIELVTRISGLLLTAIAVQLVADAIREFVREGA
jgi:multiple antibiotic resistance protein